LGGLILQDGAISEWFNYSVRGESGQQRMKDLVRAIKNTDISTTVLFISKSSESHKQFGNELVGDMFYFNHMGESGPGFTFPFQDDRYVQNEDFKVTIIETYVRLKPSTPLIKLEWLDTTGHKLEQDELIIMSEDLIPTLLDKLMYRSVSGYPQCLKLAHNRAIISDDYMDRVVRFYDLSNEARSREPLGDGRQRERIEELKERYYDQLRKMDRLELERRRGR
jgi:hypothetical protein